MEWEARSEGLPLFRIEIGLNESDRPLPNAANVSDLQLDAALSAALFCGSNVGEPGSVTVFGSVKTGTRLLLFCGRRGDNWQSIRNFHETYRRQFAPQGCVQHAGKWGNFVTGVGHL